MQTERLLVTRKVVQHRQTCGSLPRGQGTPSGTLQWPQHPQLVPVALQHPHPSLSADPRSHRQTRRLIKPHDKVDNYLDIYRGTLAAAPRSGSGPQRSEKHARRRPDTRPASSATRGCWRRIGSWRGHRSNATDRPPELTAGTGYRKRFVTSFLHADQLVALVASCIRNPPVQLEFGNGCFKQTDDFFLR
jgi:hypothetical protein